MNNIFEKISLTLILFKIFHIYLCHYFATINKIAITHLWHTMELQTICHLIVKNKVAEQHILGKYSNCIVLELQWLYSMVKNFKVAITQLFKVQQV